MLSLVIDIRSDVIEGTLVNFPDKAGRLKGVAPQILYSTTANLVYKEALTSEYLVTLMIQGVEDLCAHIVAEKNNYTKDTIAELHYVLSSPWVTSQSKTVKVEYAKDTEITESLVKSVIEESRNELVNTYDKDMVFVEQKIFAVDLNGYPSWKYARKKARSLQVSFVFTVSSQKIIQKMEAAVEKALHIKKYHLHSAILLQYIASRLRIADDREYILMHIHGEFTDMVVIKKGACAYLGSFPFGASTLTRRLLAVMGSSFDEADSTLMMYSEGKLEESQHAKIEKLLTPILDDWKNECARSFSSLERGLVLPRELYLCGASRHLPLFKGKLAELDLTVTVDETLHRDIYVSALESML